MATAAALREIEDDCPWLHADFQADLAVLAESTAEQPRRFAGDVRVLARLAARVPRCAFDERGATPWTSFRREVAVARRISDRAAAGEIRTAVSLTARLPRMLALLGEGRVTVPRARAFVEELEGVEDDVARLVDARLADKVAGWSVARIVQQTRRAVLTADPDEAARRSAQGTDNRAVSLRPEPHDQASVLITGPAVPLTRWHATLDSRARALKAAGDPRTLDQLRFDLAVTHYPCATHTPTDPTADPTTGPTTGPAAGPTADPTVDLTADAAAVSAGRRPSLVEPASTDCRLSRPVQARITVPVETSLGLSNEPGWLDGYGWLSAPTCRLLLVDAELRRVCVHARTGQVVQVAERDVRPPPTFAGLRHALLDLVVQDIPVAGDGVACRVEDRHDPSPPLRALIELRDRYDDGPTGALTRAGACELDHDTPWPAGPTAAWNLVARARRTHQLKHYGWTPLRTPTSTLWFTPAGQVVEVPRHLQPPPGIDPDPEGLPPELPDPEQLAVTDLAQLQPFAPEDSRPWLTGLPPDTTTWSWLQNDEPPF
jgi:hypothetical protein